MSMPEAFDAVDVIRAKRDNNRLSDPMIDWVIDAYTHLTCTSGRCFGFFELCSRWWGGV